MVEVQVAPTSIGTYRYDARGGGRWTHGFRSTPQAAREAAREDEQMLFEAGRCSRVQEGEQEAGGERAKAKPLRRRDHRPGD